MRESIRSVTPVFNTHRMVKEYAERLYEPAAARHTELIADGGAKAREVSEWKKEMRKIWPQVRVIDVASDSKDRTQVYVGDSLDLTVKVRLGTLDPSHVRVQAYVGESDDTTITNPTTIDLKHEKTLGEGEHLYRGAIVAEESGAYGFNVRVIPMHPSLSQPHELRLITWAR